MLIFSPKRFNITLHFTNLISRAGKVVTNLNLDYPFLGPSRTYREITRTRGRENDPPEERARQVVERPQGVGRQVAPHLFGNARYRSAHS
jgi:hypothetical protein